VRGADRGAVLELLLARGGPGQRVGLGSARGARLPRDPGDPKVERLALAEPERERDPGQRPRGGNEQHHTGGNASEETPASLSLHAAPC
jgi:hypothetical protein